MPITATPLIHRLTYRRTNHDNLHVRGYKEEGTTTTPFDMVMLNNLDRFHLVTDVLERVPGLGSRTSELHERMLDARIDARRYGREHGEDPPEIADWRWTEPSPIALNRVSIPNHWPPGVRRRSVVAGIRCTQWHAGAESRFPPLDRNDLEGQVAACLDRGSRRAG